MFSHICEICGNPFQSVRSFAKLCSDKCRTRKETIQRTEKIRAGRIPNVKNCLHCGDVFIANIRTPYQIYCSKVCLDTAMHKRAVETGKKKGYYYKNKEKYADTKSNTNLKYKDKIRFSSNKKHVLERDGYKCVDCGKTKGLIIHHIDGSGSSEKPNNDMSNLKTLCRSCHMKAHSGEDNAQFIHLTKEQILEARRDSSSWNEVAQKLGVDRATIYKRKKMFGIY